MRRDEYVYYNEPFKEWKQYQQGDILWLKDKKPDTKEIYWRPAVVLGSFPSHIHVLMMSTQPNLQKDYYCLRFNNRLQYFRPIYERTINGKIFNEIFVYKDKMSLPTNHQLFLQRLKQQTLIRKSDKYDFRERKTLKKQK